MYPVLFSIGSFPVSSFGVFLAFAFLAAVFTCWRLAKIYDINEEKILDLSILTFFASILGARLFFTFFHWELFSDIGKVFLINRYPGLSFWGGLAGGVLSLWFFCKRLKLNFWQISDFAGVGLFLGLVIGDLGCFLGGCAYGVNSNFFLSSPVTGLVGKRFPISVIESVIFLLVFFSLRKQAVRFHFDGKIIAFAFFWLGIIKFFTEFYRGDSFRLFSSSWVTFGHVFAILTLVVGIVVFYARSKRNIVADLRGIASVFSSPKRRKILLLQGRKSWYNHTVSFKVKKEKVLKTLRSLPKGLKRKLNVKSAPTNFNKN